MLLASPRPWAVRWAASAASTCAFDRTTGKYMGFTQVVARKLTRSMLFVGVLVVGLVMLGGAMPGGFLPEEDQGYFYVNIQLPGRPHCSAPMKCAQVKRILRSARDRHGDHRVRVQPAERGHEHQRFGFMFVTAADWGDANGPWPR